MDYFSVFDVSAAAMSVQKQRLDTVALNLANSSTTRSISGGPYKRQTLVVGERLVQPEFAAFLEREQGFRFGGVQVLGVQEDDSPPRLVYEPGHPDADSRGFVAYPNVDPVSEMVLMLESTRLYEASVRALDAARTMALRALEI